MDGFINSKIEKQTIYEIYRACRLCGAGAGYKMPIIQNVVHLDGAEVELKQKIRECVQIEVHQDDKMPPLICELCVDKVNDFYEFLEMCRHTNKRTRLRLGLPQQAMPRGAVRPDAGDCILGVTEPVFINEDSTENTLKTRNKSSKSGKNKRDERTNISSSSKRESRDSRDSRTESRSLRSKQPSPPRLRGTKRYNEDDVLLSKMQKSKKTEQPKSILKRSNIKMEEDSYLTPRMKRPRDRDIQVKKEIPSKRVKLLIKTLPPRTLRTSNGRSKSPPPVHKCKICKVQFDNHRSLSNHMRSHAYAKHADKKSIRKHNKDIQCTDCKKTFPRKTLLNIHKCPKQGADCSNCNKHFYSQKSLIRHRITCVQKEKEVVISPKIRRILKPLQVRVARCDPLLENVSGEHYDVSDVPYDYGLDKNLIYPNISSLRIKSEPGYMVNINDDIRQAFDADKYVHWDSEDTDSDAELDVSKTVDNLTSLSLKTIFSPRFLGKVPKKRRKVKAEKAFDSILNVSEFDTELNRGINDIIDSLDDTIDESVDKVDVSLNKSVDKSGDNDSLFGNDDAPTVSNDDFDSLFDRSNNNDKVDSESTAKSNDEAIAKSNSDENVNETSPIDISSKCNKIELGKQENGEEMKEEDNNSNKNSIENTEKSETVNILHDNTDIVNSDISNCNEEVKLTQENETNGSNVAIQVTNKEENTEEPTQIHTENEVTESDSSEKFNDTVTGKVTEANDTSINDNESTKEKVSEKIEEDKDKTEHVNGNSDEKFNMDDLEDLSDGEMDDKRLMEALDAQIGENEAGEKVTESETDVDRTSDKTQPSSMKSADLESIPDDDFNLNE
ncbi:uncharacterized protein LOC123666082 [Melitaea cinxia]|uniref:uncharacterized protein LOC123666082 n=1 Tax=Melitaea cinxia TaxID=113334 RepID=UPI001E274AB1|nr:uncharacterized protein LOC123666082 [Melitaea cinxia]